MRRLTWLAAGFGLGVVVAHRATQGGTQPPLVGAASGVAARVRRTVDAALAEGRVTMAEHEVRLREVFGTDAPYDPDDRGADRGRR